MLLNRVRTVFGFGSLGGEQKLKLHLSLVLGGASSGKSSFAERLVLHYRRPKVYIATAQAFDDEMREKIEEHRTERGPDWTTVESPHDVVGALEQVPSDSVVLFDCATMWISNRLLTDADPLAELPALLDACTACASPVVVVSNEVGLGIVPENSLARRFRVVQGAVNAAVAARADLVVGVMAGLPFQLKGQIPAELA